jgi:pyruvate/2-oxoglutarate dehydrogenase complex dihydrolipoamide dehydrogenase (E3) component
VAEQFDAIVIGTGQSGPSLAARMAREGWKTAIVERGAFGGTCVNTGCIPTKTLVASARAAFVARRGADYGVVVPGPVSVDMKKVKARKDSVAGASTASVEKWLRGTSNLEVIQGHARFVGPTAIRVGDRVLEARRIAINVGARPVVPRWPGLDTVPWLTSSTMMDVDVLPEHLVIAGGGYIGLEFAQMYRRFGSRVTVVQRGDRLLPQQDEDVSAGVRELLEGDGIDVVVDAEITGVEARKGGVVVEAGHREVAGSHLLLALGRRPNTDDLGADRAGIRLDPKGFVQVDAQLQTSVPGIWATGDVNGRGAFTHTSYNDYEILAANLFDGASRRVSDRIEAYAVYVDPPVAHCGMNERDARSSRKKVLFAKMPMTRVGRARERGETTGFMKILVDAESERILGATLFGIEADEVLHVLLDLMYADAPWTVIRRAMHVHPTVSELLPTLLEGLEPLE